MKSSDIWWSLAKNRKIKDVFDRNTAIRKFIEANK
jgi:hypothetical protein